MKDSERMYDCEWVQDLIESSIDGELPEEELAGIEAHLISCPACREDWEFAKQVQENLAGLPQPHCPERIVDAVWEEIRRQEREALPGGNSFWAMSGIQWVWRPAFAVGCTVVLAIGLWGLFGQHPAPQQPTEIAKPVEAASPQDLALATRQVEVTLAYVEHVGQQTLLAAGSRVFELVLAEPAKKAQTWSFKDGARPTVEPREN